jgi:hypothetical protein
MAFAIFNRRCNPNWQSNENRKAESSTTLDLLPLVHLPIDRFIALAGDLTGVLDREFAFLQETAQEHLHTITYWSWAYNDNRLLAGHLFFRLANHIDVRFLKSCNCRLRENDALRRLLHMISDHVATCRSNYLAKNS